MTMDVIPQVHRLTRPEGAVAYEISGVGPLVVCVPGMGDLRATYRFVAPALVEAGFRVAVTDLRGHGDSDTTFGEYGDAATARDVVALIESLGGPAVVVGNSMAAGAGVIAAAQRPDLVSGLVLVGPFVRDPQVQAPVRSLTRLATRVAMAPAWAASAWNAYLPKLFAGAKPADFDAYRASVVAAMRRPGYARAFSATTRTTHAEAEQALASVRAPALVVMGERDPDFSDPQAEATWIAERLHGEAVLVPDAGHYPQSQRPDLVVPAVLDFLRRVTPGA